MDALILLVRYGKSCFTAKLTLQVVERKGVVIAF